MLQKYETRECYYQKSLNSLESLVAWIEDSLESLESENAGQLVQLLQSG
jgi:hypothetical protein